MASAMVEPPLRYYPGCSCILTQHLTGAGTLYGGQFDWGGRLPKSNGGARRLAHDGWKPSVECNGKSQPDCKRDTSSRDESRS